MADMQRLERRVAGAVGLGGVMASDLAARAVYRNRPATAEQEQALGERLVCMAVYELVMQLRHFHLDADVLAALQMPPSKLGSALDEAVLQQAFPQTDPDR